LLGVKVGQPGVLDHQLVAIRELDDDVVMGLMSGIENGLKRRKVEITHVNAVARLQMLDRVNARAFADEKGVVAAAAVELVVAGAAEQQIPAHAAEEVIIAIIADQGIIASASEEVIIPLAAENGLLGSSSTKGTPRLRATAGLPSLDPEST
jgi:hypothetical protein